ncbi:Mobile element protein [hydrothermal vent metagenome]|uniref:Mobile element protein n=1 Tax=hydrothermal vent metagenome TaxID=652676 RepID=A0A3B0W1Y1_9ZZZZ
MAYLGDISLFKTSAQVASFAGLNPCVETSGTSIDKTSLSKSGNKRLRKALYMPAIVAKKHNSILTEFYERLIKKGKPKKVALCAVMRKLLVLSFGVLKSEAAFDSKYRKEKAC